MLPDRFDTETMTATEQLLTQSQGAFLLLAVGGPGAAPMSTMEWFYQHLYQQAQQANRQSATRELFAVMN